ncbi:MAG TPA: hypothetical protein VMA77_09530 [Solirubrobacteraceae bacterium]|nr:hypothetical protein [Solirubrobacteraceae bacterium]
MSTTEPKPLIPRKTDPKAKFIRTGEGILVFAFNVAMLVIPIVTSALSATEAVKYAAILNAVAVFSRSGLKAAALLPQVTGVPAGQVSQPVAQDAANVIADAVKQALADGAKPPSLQAVGQQVDQDVQEVEKLVTDAKNGAPEAAAVEALAVAPSMAALQALSPSPAPAGPSIGTPGAVTPIQASPAAPPDAGTTVPPGALGTSAAGDAQDVIPDSEEFGSAPSDADIAAGAKDGTPVAAGVAPMANPNGGGQ